MVKVYRCKICGEGYIGDEMPSHCPFCGAHKDRIVLANQWSWPKFELTDISRKNLEEALTLEISNFEFYFCAAKKTDNEADQTMFKRLAKIEREHADTISKLLNADGPDISKKKDSCNPDNTDNLRESHEREENAIKHYSAFLSQATEERVKEVFSAIIEIEKDHLSLTEGRI
ncbi:MAG: ferritin [Candidatus Aenigmarchaeota archaeon]|nr:ferritin [Candidatus Aenigmarchaeota archaeon]MCK5476821.1 ferritin [Candidatus Aenigmarchaeota archaeon]